jgi:hypothetical protein
MVGITNVDCQQPPCVTELSDEDLVDMESSPSSPPNCPIHTQSVERAVKLTTEASKISYSWEKRHLAIVAKSASREARKPFKTQKDYK